MLFGTIHDFVTLSCQTVACLSRIYVGAAARKLFNISPRQTDSRLKIESSNSSRKQGGNKYPALQQVWNVDQYQCHTRLSASLSKQM